MTNPTTTPQVSTMLLLRGDGVLEKISAEDGFARGLYLAIIVVQWTALRGGVLGGRGGGVA